MEALGGKDPRRVGPYRLLRVLGQGGMGRVYVGYGRDGRLVAVKVILDRHSADSRYQKRFKREVRAARSVGGPYTTAVVAAGADAKRPWLATEYVPAPALQEAVACAGPFPLPALLVLGQGLAAALAAIHRAGLVHRDLNPRNVLVTAASPRVIDFGIARIEDATVLTATGPLGTPGYMAPEQIHGAAVPASDVFALAATLVFAARGSGPFHAADAVARVRRTLTGEPDLDRVPPLLVPLVRGCLAKDPAQRPALSELAALLADAAERHAADVPATVGRSVDAGADSGEEGDTTVAFPTNPTNPTGPTGPSDLTGSIDPTAATRLPEDHDDWLPVAVRALIDRHQADADALVAEARRGVTRRRVLTGLGALAVPGAAGAWYVGARGDNDGWQEPPVAWRFTRPGQVFESAYPYPGGLIAASTTGALFRIDRYGTQVWQATLDAGVALCSAYFGDFVAALDKTGTWYLLDRDDGRILWRRPDVVSVDAAAGAVFAYGKDGIVRSLILDGSRPEAWSFPAGAPDGTVRLVGADTLWVVSRRDTGALDDSAVDILDTATGKARSHRDFPRDSLWYADTSGTALMLSGNTLSEGGIPQGVICAVPLADRQQPWRIVTPSLLHAVPVGDGRVVVAQADGKVDVRLVDTGALDWTVAVNAGQALDGSVSLVDWPVLADGRAHLGSEEGRVYTLDLRSRDTPWTFTAPHVDGEPEALYPFVSGSIVYAAGGQGRLYALRADTGAPLWRTTGSGSERPYAGPLPIGVWLLRDDRIDAVGGPLDPPA